jgi:manganese transport protein
VAGTMTGQIAMEGFLNLKMNPQLRRLITRGLAMVPALAVILLWGERSATSLLIASQVVLSLQLPFAVIPLVRFTSNREIMRSEANGRAVRLAAYAMAAVIVAANAWLTIKVII